MTQRIRILYNDTCPVCSREIGLYQRRAGMCGLPHDYLPLDRAAELGLTEDQAARRLHLWQGDTALSGMAAFRVLWADLPGWRWLARVSGWPVLRPMLDLVYDRIAAPLLYRAHRRRRMRKGNGA